MSERDNEYGPSSKPTFGAGFPMEDDAYTRRRCLKIFAGLSVGMLVSGKVVNACANTDVKEKKGDEAPQIRNSYSQTVVDQSIAQILKIACTAICEKMNIPCGNASASNEKIQHDFHKNPARKLIESCIIDPWLEEAAFRGWPSYEIDRNPVNVQQSKWNIGIPLSAFFAYLHSIKFDRENSKFTFNQTVPITQFIGALYYWFFMRKRGFSHAFLAHSVNNAGAIASVLLSGAGKSDGESKHP